MNKELKEAIYEMNETHYEPLRTTERNKVIKLVEQELSKLDKIQEIINHADEEDTVTYQQRLDKVLEKFENGNHGMFYKVFIEDGAIEYYTSTKKFYWTSYSDEFVITLPTVEHLLKDLEQ